MLKVSAFYLEKQKSCIPKKNIFQAEVSKYAKIDPKDGACSPNFQWRFWFYLHDYHMYYSVTLVVEFWGQGSTGSKFFVQESVLEKYFRDS